MKFNKISICLKPFLNGLSFFLGVLFLGLMSCSSATVSSPSSPIKDNIPPTLTISTDESLGIDMLGTITFTFSENVTNFILGDIQLLMNGGGGGVTPDRVKFVTNSQKNYSLEIKPTIAGTLTVTVPANSFYDLSGNQNTDSFSTNFSVEDKTPPTVTISTNEPLEIDKTGTITFTFSEEVTNFIIGDIQLLMNGFDLENDSFVTSSQKSYSLKIKPKVAGTLTITVSNNSFEDLSGNQNTDSFSTNFLVEDKTPPTVTSIKSETLIEGESASLSIVFNKKVNNFTPDDIQLLMNGVDLDNDSFVTNTLISYSLKITPTAIGTLTITIPTNSFEDLYGNQNDEAYSNSFTVHSLGTTTHTISFKLNGGSFISPQITNLKVFTNKAIEQIQLRGILTYPPTGPKPNINAVTRGVFEWRNNGSKYEISTPVTSDLTLEAVWSNSCGKVETFHPPNRDELKTYADAAVGANATTNLNHIDTSAITDMVNLFYSKSSFNGEIDCWNIAKITNMNNMFENASSFNQDISTWNVGKVNNMKEMFKRASVFNQDIRSWDVSKVNNMSWMFKNAIAFNQDIGSWDVSKVNNMSWMFSDASVFNQDISSWNVSNVTNMSYMFVSTSYFNGDISSWNVSKVTDMSYMFYDASAFNGDISSWNVSKVTDMSWMFSSAIAFNQDISSWNVSNVTNMSYMFYNATVFDQDLSKWPVSNVTKHDNMFIGSVMESKISQQPTF